jgi:hypothetical protein
MKRKIVPVLIGLLVVVVGGTGLFTACSDVGGFNDLTSLAKSTPEDVGMIIFIDVKSVRSDKDLNELYNEMMEGFEGEIIPSRMGINIDDIQYIAMTEIYNPVVRMGGDFDFDAIRDYNLENDYEKDEYKGVEIWYDTDNALAIHDNTLITGNKDSIKECIDVINDPKKSIFELNEDIRDIVNNLPDGPISVVSEEGLFPDANAMGTTLTKVNADTFKESSVFKFNTEDGAESALNDIKEDMDSDEISNFQISRSKELIEFSFEVDIDKAGLFR